jgi:ubiquinone/menaquinone biosynthesis C-methylase UbiE
MTPQTVLDELHRILRPGGSIVFLEHGLAPDPSVQRWQRRIDPLSTRLLGNCHMSREVSGTFEHAGFETRCMGSDYVPDVPRYAGWVE